ncbi:MAG: cupredoxin domain-containing protein [Hyphomicrobiales bacterium]
MTIRFTAAAAAFWIAAMTGAAAAGTADAQIKLFQFQPKTLEVAVGTTVKWINGDDIEHSVTAGAPGQESGDFDSGFFKKGGSFEFTFKEPGTHTYFCKRHPSMKAAVTVK